jgi:hypothetical protein
MNITNISYSDVISNSGPDVFSEVYATLFKRGIFFKIGMYRIADAMDIVKLLIIQK